MNNFGGILGVIDVFWILCFITLAFVVSHIARFKWINWSTLLAFFLFKILIGVGFSTWALNTEQDFDARGYFTEGQSYSTMFIDLVTGKSMSYVTTTPFFGYDGYSTERLSSLTGLILAINGNSFMGSMLVLCCAGMAGQLLIYRYLRLRFSMVKPRYFLLVLFHPSLALWSGMLTKDALGILALGLLIYHTDRLLVRFKLVNLIGVLAGVQLALGFRSFILAMFGAFLLTAVWDRKICRMSAAHAGADIFSSFYVVGSIIASICAIGYFVKNYGQDMVATQQASVEIYSTLEGGSNIRNAELSYSVGGLLALPVGVMNSLLRPFLWEVSKPMQIFAALENFLILVVVARGWHAFFFGLDLDERRNIRGVVWGFALMTIICAAGVGLYSSNLGTISRYRIPLVPLFVAGPCLALGYRNMSRRSTPPWAAAGMLASMRGFSRSQARRGTMQ